VDWEIAYKDLRRLNWLTLLIMGSLSYFLMSQSFTLGIILGGLIIIVNFKVLQHTIRGAFSPDDVMTSSRILIIMKYYLRLLALGIIIFILVKRGWVDPAGLAFGLSTVVISITSFGIKEALKTMTAEAAQ
jgi:hypothetical protein